MQYVALALTWGASFLFIKVGLRGLSPFQLVTARLSAGAMVLTILAWLSRTPLPRQRSAWLHLGAVGILLCALPFMLFAWAGQHLPSGLSSIYNATTPLMTTTELVKSFETAVC